MAEIGGTGASPDAAGEAPAGSPPLDAAAGAPDAAAEAQPRSSVKRFSRLAVEEEVVEEVLDEGPEDFHKFLRRGFPVLAYLYVSCAMPAFRASKTTRSLLSSLLTVRVSFHVVFHADVKDKAYEVARRRMERVRQRLPHTACCGPLNVFLWFKVKDMPIRRATFNRSLSRLFPAFNWEEGCKIQVISRGNMDTLDKLVHSSLVTHIGGTDVLVLQQQPSAFRKLIRLSVDLPQLAGFSEDFELPMVERLKVRCQDAAFGDGIFDRIYQIFPNLNRLHLDMLPAGLLPLCGPGFKAPRDLRLSLTEGSSSSERHANVFVASHLFSLPFSWSDTFFQQVQRLQMSELTEDLQGLSLENLVATLRKLPHLRRLGTVSSRAACLFDISRENCKLEELVLVVELEDVKDFFSSMLPLEQRKGRCCLQRLAVHLLCSDGAARLRLDVENAICAGWYNIAASLMRPQGWVTFSMASPPLRETALGQLPWFLPQHFCLDTVDYDRQPPTTTPLDRPLLPFPGVEGLVQPSGTLVAGTLKRQMKSEAKSDFDAPDSASGSITGSVPPSPSSPSSRISPKPDTERTSSSRGFGRQTISGSTTPTNKLRGRGGKSMLSVEPLVPEWFTTGMADAIEGLITAAEKIRAAYET